MHVQSYRSGPRHYVAANVPAALHPFQRAANTHRIKDRLVVMAGVEGVGEHDSLQPLLGTEPQFSHVPCRKVELCILNLYIIVHSLEKLL